MKKFGLLCFCLTAILLAGCGKEKEDAQPDKGIDEAKIQIETSQGRKADRRKKARSRSRKRDKWSAILPENMCRKPLGDGGPLPLC